MVNNALTWQNVAGPDFSTALDGMQGAGQAWARGFDGLSGALGDWRTRQKEQASAEALGKAMGINSTAGWDQAMAGGGGFGALGINSRDATPELLNYMAGNRGKLLDNESTAVNTSNNIADQKIEEDNQSYLNTFTRPNAAADRANADEDRARVEAGWAQADLVTQDNNADYAKTRAAGVRDLELKNLALDLVQKNKGKSQEELSVLLENSGLAPNEVAQAIGHLNGVDAAIFNPTAGNARAAANSKVMRDGKAIAKEQQTKLTWNTNLSPEMQVFANGSQSFGTGDGVAEKLVTNLLGDSGDAKWENNENFGNSSAKILNIFNEMTKYGYDPKTGTQLPPELIAQVIKNNLKGDGWITNGDPAIDQSKVKKILDVYKDPQQIAAMRQMSANRDTEMLNIDAFNAGLKDFELKLGNARENGTADDVAAIEAQAYEFFSNSGFDKPKAGATITTTPQQAAEIARANAAMEKFGDPKNGNGALAAQANQAAADQAAYDAQLALYNQGRGQHPDSLRSAQTVRDFAGGFGSTVGNALDASGSALNRGAGIVAGTAMNIGNEVIGAGNAISNAITPRENQTPGQQLATDLAERNYQEAKVDARSMINNGFFIDPSQDPNATQRGTLADFAAFGLKSPTVTAAPKVSANPAAAPALPVEKIAQQGTGQFANEPASVVSDMISSSLDLSAKDSETLDLAMRQIEAGLLSDADEVKSRDLIESILYDSLLKQKGNVSPEVKSLLADIESKYLPLFK